MDEEVYTLAECLLKVHESMCKGEGEPEVINCESGGLRLSTPSSRRGLSRIYLGTDYICLTSLDLRIFRVVQQHLRDYILAMADLLSFVAISLTSVVYEVPMPNACTHTDYPHLYEELVTFV